MENNKSTEEVKLVTIPISYLHLLEKQNNQSEKRFFAALIIIVALFICFLLIDTFVLDKARVYKTIHVEVVSSNDGDSTVIVGGNDATNKAGA